MTPEQLHIIQHTLGVDKYGKQRIDMEPLWAELKADLEKEKAEGLR